MKKNVTNNFTKPLQYDTFVTFKLQVYHIIIRIHNCPILGIPVPSYGFLTRSKMAALIVQ